MKKALSITAIILGISLFQAPDSFGQTRKNKVKNEATKEESEETDNENTEEQQSTKRKRKAPSGIAFGIEGGLNIAMLEGNYSNSDAIVGVTAGGLVNIHLAGGFYLQPGLFYVMNGGGDVHINTLAIPVNALYKFDWPGNGSSLFVTAGPYFGAHMSGSVDGSSLSIGSDNNDDIRRVDIGLGSGVGLELHNGLFFRFRHQRALTNLLPGSDPTSSYYPYSRPTIYAVSSAFTIGYMFGNTPRHKKVRSKDDEYIDRR